MRVRVHYCTPAYLPRYLATAARTRLNCTVRHNIIIIKLASDCVCV